MFCRYCGKEIDNTARFCNCCGKELSEEKETKNNFVDEKENKDIKIKLEPKDGNIHVLLVEEILFGSNRKIEELYNKKINKIIKTIQEEGYEILDIKLSLAQGTGYETLIIYK